MTRFEKGIGLAAFLALIGVALCCRPAWSPDSSTVVFHYLGKDRSGIALHHVKTGRTENIVSFAGEMRDRPFQVFWYKGRILALGHPKRETLSSKVRENKAVLMEIDPGTHSFHQIRTLDFGKATPSPLTTPVIDQEGHIWLGGIEPSEFSLVRIFPDFEILHTLEPGRMVQLYRGGSKIFYISFQGTSAPEIGIFHPDFHADKITFEKLTELKKESMQDIAPFLAASPDGATACTLVSFADGHTEFVFVQAEGGKTRWLTLPEDCLSVGGFVYSRDGKTLWHIYFPRKEHSRGMRPVLAAFDPEKGLVRKKELAMRFTNPGLKGLCFLQPAISPDGRWLAISTAYYYQEEEHETSRMVLIDLQSEGLDTRFIQPPQPASNSRGDRSND